MNYILLLIEIKIKNIIYYLLRFDITAKLFNIFIFKLTKTLL